MEQVTIKLVPRNLDNPTIEHKTTNPSYVISDIARDTYDYSVESDKYEEVTGTIVVGASRFVERIDLVEISPIQVETWIPKSRKRAINFEMTVEYDGSLYPNEGYTVEGVKGEETQTYELKHINGEPTSQERNVSPWVQTKAPINGKLVIGTKEDEVELVSILTQENAKVTYSTNAWQGGARIPNDVVPIDGSSFEIRQWENPSGGLTISDGDLGANKAYTVQVTLENIGNAIQTAKFVIGMAFFGGKHYFDGTERTINPSAGQYDFTAYMPTTGPVEYTFQFWTEPDTPNGDYFQFNFDNDDNNIIVKVSDLAVYEGHLIKE